MLVGYGVGSWGTWGSRRLSVEYIANPLPGVIGPLFRLTGASLLVGACYTAGNFRARCERAGGVGMK